MVEEYMGKNRSRSIEKPNETIHSKIKEAGLNGFSVLGQRKKKKKQKSDINVVISDVSPEENTDDNDSVESTHVLRDWKDKRSLADKGGENKERVSKLNRFISSMRKKQNFGDKTCNLTTDSEDETEEEITSSSKEEEESMDTSANEESGEDEDEEIESDEDSLDSNELVDRLKILSAKYRKFNEEIIRIMDELRRKEIIE